MPHINTGMGEGDSTASAYIVRLSADGPKILLHKHKKLDIFLQFGGHVEKTENIWQAVKHEVLEESGYHLEQLQLLQPPSRITKLTGVVLHPYPVVLMSHSFIGMDHFHVDTAFAFVTSEDPAETVDKSESQERVLFMRQELVDLPKESIPENVREICLFIFDHCLTEWERVPANNYS